MLVQLKYEFFSGESAAVEEIDPFSWLAGAIVLLLMWIAQLAWILIWAADNGTDTLNAWGLQFFMALIQDLLLNQPIKLYVMHVLAVEILRPRVRHIYHVLNNVVTRARGDMKGNNKKNSLFSVAVVQHVSPSCRAARNKVCSRLPSSKMLAAITDYDVFLCRDSRHTSITTISFFLVLIPTVLALTNEWIQDGCLTITITAMWALFLVANNQLLEISIWALIAPYLFIFLVIVIDLFVLSPRRKRAPTPSKHTGLERHGGKGWRRKARQHSVLVSKPFNQRVKSLMNKFAHQMYSIAISRTTTWVSPSRHEQALIWRNMNISFRLQGGCSTSISSSTITSPTGRSLASRNLNRHETYMGTDDRYQLAVISPEVLDMRLSSLQNSVRQRKNVSLKKRMDSFLWQPDALSHQCDSNMTLTSLSVTSPHQSTSRSALSGKWFQLRREVENDRYWSAY